MKKKIFSGMRPTGKLHLGHLVGALQNWAQLQDQYNCVYCIVDWHAFMGEYENSGPSVIIFLIWRWIGWPAGLIRSARLFISSPRCRSIRSCMYFFVYNPAGLAGTEPHVQRAAEGDHDARFADVWVPGISGFAGGGYSPVQGERRSDRGRPAAPR